jgi:hypothetical protein
VADDVLIAIDPGQRVGVAWVAFDGRLLRAEVVDVEALTNYPFPEAARIVVGDSTGSRTVQARLRGRTVPFEVVDEHRTSEEARALYWRDHPARGLLRLVPRGMRVPPRPIDDYAAYAIALRAMRLRRTLVPTGG